MLIWKTIASMFSFLSALYQSKVKIKALTRLIRWPSSWILQNQIPSVLTFSSISLTVSKESWKISMSSPLKMGNLLTSWVTVSRSSIVLSIWNKIHLHLSFKIKKMSTQLHWLLLWKYDRYRWGRLCRISHPRWPKKRKKRVANFQFLRRTGCWLPRPCRRAVWLHLELELYKDSDLMICHSLFTSFILAAVEV